MTHQSRSGLTSEMHFLKFGLLIVTPSALWVGSTITANPTTSAWGTFGQVCRPSIRPVGGSFMLNYQIFAIGIILGNILNICVELQDVGREKLISIFWSVLRSEEIKVQNHADVNLPATQHSESSRLCMDTGSPNDIDVTGVCTSISLIELSELGISGLVRRATR